MSEILVDQPGMGGLLMAQNDSADDIHAALSAMPNAVDGGAASALMGLLVTSAAEIAGSVAQAHRSLTAVAADVLNDLGRTDDQIRDDVDQLAASAGR